MSTQIKETVQSTDINVPSSTGSIFRQNKSSLVMVATKKHITARYYAFYDVQIMYNWSPNYEHWKRYSAFRNQSNKLTAIMLTPNQLFASSQMFPFLSAAMTFSSPLFSNDHYKTAFLPLHCQWRFMWYMWHTQPVLPCRNIRYHSINDRRRIQWPWLF